MSRQRIPATNPDNPDISAKALGLEPLSLDATDAEIRMHTKQLLIGMLNDGSITSQYFAQFKDVFGLANQSDRLEVHITNYADVITDCPSCGLNVYAPANVRNGIDSADSPD